MQVLCTIYCALHIERDLDAVSENPMQAMILSQAFGGIKIAFRPNQFDTSIHEIDHEIDDR